MEIDPIIISGSYSGSYEMSSEGQSNLVSNDFLPFICFHQLRRYAEYSYNAVITYSKPPRSSAISKSTSSANIMKSLNYGNVSKYVFTSSTYFITKGFITDDKGDILLALTIKKQCYKDNQEVSSYLSEYESTFTYDNFVLFISSELATNKKHSVLYRRLQNIYLNDCYEKGMEVRFLPSSVIEKNTFAVPFKLRFNSVTELDFHLRNEVKSFFRVSEETKLHIDIPPISIVETSYEVDPYLEELPLSVDSDTIELDF